MMKRSQRLFAIVLLAAVGPMAASSRADELIQSSSHPELSLASEGVGDILEGPDSDSRSRLGFGDIRQGHGRLKCSVCVHPHCDPGPEQKVDICTNAMRCFTAHVRDYDGEERRSRGCTLQLTDTAFYCSVTSYDGSNTHEDAGGSAQYAFSCCKEDMCNNATAWPVLPAVPGSNDVSSDDIEAGASPVRLTLAVLCPIFILFILLAVVGFIMRRNHKKRMAALAPPIPLYGDDLQALRAQPVGDSTLREYHDDGAMTSGSGAGMPFLQQRTLAKEITLSSRIGKGRYGEVWCGTWNGDLVAVKIFLSRDENSFRRETDIYGITLLRHENILGYIGHDNTSLHACTQMWLVTHYHELGSLYDYLNCEDVEICPTQAHTFILTALHGIVHLHTEIFGTQGKPGIAHRDLKTKNILVKRDLTCVIADFGLAVTHKDKTNELSIPENTRVGTKRYMSPEVLDASIVRDSNFEAYKKSDIYSFALVMWEILRRMDIPGVLAEPFALPYHQYVGPDPSFDDMRQVVCVRQMRPEIHSRLETTELTSNLTRLMRECWHSSPSARLSALRLKKTIRALLPKPEILVPLKATFPPSVSFSKEVPSYT